MQDWTDARTPLGVMRERIRVFVDEREWGRFHSPKNLAMSIAIEAAELMEIVQWVSTEEAYASSADSDTLQQIEDEVADVMIYCMSLANVVGFDLAQAIARKIAKNGRKYPVPKAHHKG